LIKRAFFNRIGKFCVLVAASLLLPILAHAGPPPLPPPPPPGHPPAVPETNAAWVLIPFFGAVLLYSWRQFSRAKESH
jgi:hypothetical protein